MLGLLAASGSLVAALSIGGSEVPGPEQPPPEQSPIDLVLEGDEHRAKREHDRAIAAYAEAYELYKAEGRSWRDNHPLVKALGESCEAVLADATRSSTSLGDCADVIGDHTQAVGDAPRHRRKYERDGARLGDLHTRLVSAQSTQDLPSPPVEPPLADPPITTGPKPTRPRRVTPTKPTVTPKEPKPESNPSKHAKDETRSHLVLASIGVAGGSLLTLTGTALMLNGAAWTRCSRDNRAERNSPSDRCLDLLGVASATDPGSAVTDSITTPEDYEASAAESRIKSVRNWTLGSITLAAGVGAIVGSAIAIHRIRAKRARYSVAPAWSRRSALATVTVRF